MSLSLHRLKNFKAVKFRQRLICLYDWPAWFANGFKLQFPGFILSLFKVLKIHEFLKKRLLLSTLVAPFVTNDRQVQHGFVYLVALVQFSPVGNFVGGVLGDFPASANICQVATNHPYF